MKKENIIKLYNIRYKLFYFLILSILLYLNKKYIKKIKNIKVCLCTIGKLENKYVREYVEHYKKYEIDKIFIYDNNDINGESFENVLSDFIDNKYVEIINYRGKKTIQINMLNNCYKNNFKLYDWFIMFDMDEFIYLKNYGSIKNYLNNKKFKKCKVINLNRPFHTDNNQIYYKNKSLSERFPEKFYNIINVKSILRGHIPNIKINSLHRLNYKLKACNGFGKNNNKTDFKYYYIDHYYFKSTEEFINKINRGDAYYSSNNKLKFNKIKFYFAFNKITLEKII